MSDRMNPIPFDRLMNWILEEYRGRGSIFGVRRLYRADPQKTLSVFGERLEMPFGPAAGPQTQLAQNLVAAYAAGGRFFELKTVQTLDGEDLPVAKPCIDARDECYNVEWSTELRVPQAMEEYIKAWYAIKLISREFSLGGPEGFVFNMSVGYDLKGIQSKKIDDYLENMKDAGNTSVWNGCRDWTLSHLGSFRKIDKAYVDSISSRVSRSVTESTLHGCPPAEIEKIAGYLITEKGLNTFIKCNPTLLGYDFARNTMDRLGFGYMEFSDHHFRNDMQYGDAVPMLKRLTVLAAEHGLQFGVKLTNTMPVKNPQDAIPGEEMYMSGRALYPLTIELARRLSREFGGSLKISFSGGADAFNIRGIFEAGIWPVTEATTLLKPGGYQRLLQQAEILSACEYRDFDGVDLAAMERLAKDSLENHRFVKPVKPAPSRKMEKKVPLFDCFDAPCSDTCPIHQDIPEYVELVGQGKYLEALRVITEKNPLPFITGTICPHGCMGKCTRNFYEEPVRIREVKLEAAEHAFADLKKEWKVPAVSSEAKVAVVGGGPAGLAAAYFLGRAGIRSEIFEKRSSLGGIVRHIIPEFRISAKAVDNDVELVKSMGCEVRLGTEVSDVKQLRKDGYEYVILATGAWKHGELRLKKGEALSVFDFLSRFKTSPESVSLGENVVVVGGGNTAMDAARAAKRVSGVKNVSLVYRRNRRYMPADEEELQMALEDGVEFRDLLSPVSLENGVLLCERMTLGAPDESGRRSPVGTGEITEVPADTVIAAVGEKIDSGFFSENGIELTEKGLVKCDPATGETSIPHVYAAGDAQRGPSVVVWAIAGAKNAAEAIIREEKVFRESVEHGFRHDFSKSVGKRGILLESRGARGESRRCLDCGTVCESCVDVCPNRANVAVSVPGMEKEQILHVDGMCNECGNCMVFCPYQSAPYQDKFTLFSSEEDFEDSTNQGFLVLDRSRGLVRVRLEGRDFRTSLENPDELPENVRRLMRAVLDNYAYLLN